MLDIQCNGSLDIIDLNNGGRKMSRNFSATKLTFYYCHPMWWLDVASVDTPTNTPDAVDSRSRVCDADDVHRCQVILAYTIQVLVTHSLQQHRIHRISVAVPYHTSSIDGRSCAF